MAEGTLHAIHNAVTSDLRERMAAHQVNGVRELASADEPATAAAELAGHVYALALALAAAVRPGEAEWPASGGFGLLTGEVIAGTFEALGHLAGQAHFFARQAAAGRHGVRTC